jgi:hypothetical protein
MTDLLKFVDPRPSEPDAIFHRWIVEAEIEMLEF